MRRYLWRPRAPACQKTDLRTTAVGATKGMQWVVVALHLCRMVCIGLVLHLCSACTWASSQAAQGAHSAVAAQHPLLLGLIGGDSDCETGSLSSVETGQMSAAETDMTEICC